MTGWIVLAAILLALFLLSCVRVGGTVEYSATGLTVAAKVGVFRLALYPAKKKQKKVSKATQTKGEEPQAKAGGSLADFKAYLPILAETAGRLLRKIRVDRLHLDLVAAAPDPAEAAMVYGFANAAIGMLLPIFENNFKIKERRIRTAVDFQATRSFIHVYAALTLTVGQAVSVGLRLAVHLLKRSSRVKTEEKTEKEAV